MSADNDNDRWWMKSTIREYTDHDIDNMKLMYWLLGIFTATVFGVVISLVI